MFFGNNWVQYLSSDSDSSGDYGYRPRDDEIPDPDPGGDGQVGGGTPWVPTLPKSILTPQHPSIVVWNDRDEERRPGFENWGGKVNNVPIDVPNWKAIPITLRNQKLPGQPNTVVCGRIYTSNLNYNWENYVQPAPGGPEVGEKAGGATLRLPYYWDGVSPKPVPSVTVSITKGFNNSGNPPLEWRVSTAGGTVTAVPSPGSGNQYIPGVVCPLDGPQLNSFVPGWNEVIFKIGLTRNNGLVPSSILPVFWPAGIIWNIQRVNTSMPIRLNFEFTVQQNFRTKLGIQVVRNGTTNPGTDNGNDAQRIIQEFVVPFGPIPNGPDERTVSRWDVYSSNPSDLNDYWWEAKIADIFQYNHESGMRMLIGPEDTIGPDTNSVPLPDENYCKYENTRINTPPPGGSRQWKGLNKNGVANTWVPPEHMPMNISSTAHWYFPYNTKCLTYLVEGDPNHDVFDVV